MTVYKKHLCNNCGFSWNPKGIQPTFCPNCSSGDIGLSTFQSDLGIESID